MDMKRNETISWTPHLEESLRILSEQQECEGDALLVAQVQIQLVIEKLTQMALQSPSNPPPELYLSALGKRLHGIRAVLAPSLARNSMFASLPNSKTWMGKLTGLADVILAHLHYAELLVVESNLAGLAPLSPLNPDLGRYALFSDAIAAIKAWFDIHLSIPWHGYFGMTFGYWKQMSRCMTTLYHLTLLDDPNWDRRAVRLKVDVAAICDHLVSKFEECIERRRAESNGAPSTCEHTLAKPARGMRKLKATFTSEYAALEASENAKSHALGQPRLIPSTSVATEPPPDTQREEDTMAVDILPASGTRVDINMGSGQPFSASDTMEWIDYLLNLETGPQDSDWTALGGGRLEGDRTYTTTLPIPPSKSVKQPAAAFASPGAPAVPGQGGLVVCLPGSLPAAPNGGSSGPAVPAPTAESHGDTSRSFLGVLWPPPESDRDLHVARAGTVDNIYFQGRK